MSGFKPRDFKYGSLNDIDKPLIAKRIDLQNDTAVNVFKNLTKGLYTPNATLGTGPYKGIVLRIEGNAGSNSQPEVGNWASNWLKHTFGSGGKQPSIVQIKVRIPELHAMLPMPDELGPNSKDTAIIEMYPTFIAQSTEVPTPEIGGLVWVDFGNKVNFTDPIYIKPFETKSGKGNSSSQQGGKNAFNNGCAGVFRSNKPSGDIIAGKNKPLSHTGLPLNSRVSSKSVSQEYSFLKGLRYTAETLNKWQEAIESKGVPGTTWFGGVLSNGAEDPDHITGKRDTLIFAPNTTDFSMPIEMMYFFHGLNEFGDKHDFTDRFSMSVKNLSEEGRNFVLIIPELPWSLGVKGARGKSVSELAWAGRDNFSNFHSEVLATLRESFSNLINVSFISITAHGAGGSALKNAALFGGLDSVKPNKITFAEASYLDYAQIVWDRYVSKNPSVELNVLVASSGAANKRAKDLISSISSSPSVYVEEMAGKNHQQIGDISLSFINPKQQKDIDSKMKTAMDKSSGQIKEDEIVEPIPQEESEKQKKDFNLKEPNQPNAKIPMPLNANISPSAIPKSSTTPKAKAAVIREAVPFEEARVRVKDYGTLNETLLVPVQSIEGKVCLLHKLAASRLMAMNDAWQRENSGMPPILVVSGFRKHKWQSEDEYNSAMMREFGSIDEGKKWKAFDSPHEIGLAMDIGNNGITPSRFTNEQQKQTRLYKWLVNNAHQFGFTPYKVECWHWECRLPKESWESGEEFTENLAVRVEDVGGSSHIPTNRNDNSNNPCISKIGDNKALPAPKGTFKPTSSPELQLTWNEFAKGKPPVVSNLLSLGMMVDQKWGELIKRYLGFAPYGMICVRIGHESHGNEKCGPTGCCGEVGLMQVWCGKEWKKGQGPMSGLGALCQKKLPGFDPFNPSHNLWAGISDVNVRGYRLKNGPQGKLFPVSDYQHWGATMIGMNIGDGALARLLNISNAREGQALTDLIEFVTQAGSDLQQYQSAFGSQTAESVARRVLIMSYWIKAAEQIEKMETADFGFAKINSYVV